MYTEMDRAKGVYDYVITTYQGDCFTSSATSYRVKELGQCLPNSAKFSYKKLRITRWARRTPPTASARGPRTPRAPQSWLVRRLTEISMFDCSAQIIEFIVDQGTLFVQEFSASDCRSAPSPSIYHAGDACEPEDNGGALCTTACARSRARAAA